MSNPTTKMKKAASSTVDKWVKRLSHAGQQHLSACDIAALRDNIAHELLRHETIRLRVITGQYPDASRSGDAVPVRRTDFGDLAYYEVDAEVEPGVIGTVHHGPVLGPEGPYERPEPTYGGIVVVMDCEAIEVWEDSHTCIAGTLGCDYTGPPEVHPDDPEQRRCPLCQNKAAS